MIRKIIEGKLRYNREKLEYFKKKGPRSAINDYRIRVHLLEDILEDADEANEVSPTDNNCNIQHVSNLLCGFFEPINDSSSATICKHCGREKWMHPKAT